PGPGTHLHARRVARRGAARAGVPGSLPEGWAAERPGGFLSSGPPFVTTWDKKPRRHRDTEVTPRRKNRWLFSVSPLCLCVSVVPLPLLQNHRCRQGLRRVGEGLVVLRALALPAADDAQPLQVAAALRDDGALAGGLSVVKVDDHPVPGPAE